MFNDCLMKRLTVFIDLHDMSEISVWHTIWMALLALHLRNPHNSHAVMTPTDYEVNNAPYTFTETLSPTVQPL